MRLTAGMDEGPVYKQKSLQLNGTETKASLTEELQSLGAEILGEALPSITGGDLKPRQQPHPDRATYTKKITKEDGVIDWNEPAEVIERQIRAYAGWPKSSAKLADIDVIITSATLMVTPEVPRPGEIKFDKKHLYIGTGKDWLEVLSLQIPGKKEMPVTAFLAGYSNKL